MSLYYYKTTDLYVQGYIAKNPNKQKIRHGKCKQRQRERERGVGDAERKTNSFKARHT